MEAVRERFNDNMSSYIQDGKCFRYDIATLLPYKGNRDNKHKPKYYKEIKEYLIEHWDAIPVRVLESDDAIGIEQFRNTDKYSVIVSTDKDMNTIYGWHYNWVKGDLFYLSKEQADKFFFRQMLIGDSTDNIPGINGMGEKRSAKFVQEHGGSREQLQQAVQELYKHQYGDMWQPAYEEVGKLLYILRYPDDLDKVPYILYG